MINSQKSKLIRSYRLMTLEASYRSYFHRDNSWWWAAGFELAMVQKLKMTLDNGSTRENLPVENGTGASFFAIPLLSIGRDWRLGGSWFLISKLQVGVWANSDPVNIFGELGLAVAYGFY